MAAPHVRLKSAFRQRSSPSQFIAARALLRIAGPVETSSLDDLRATVKEPAWGSFGAPGFETSGS
jgi:hypothetical protein